MDNQDSWRQIDPTTWEKQLDKSAFVRYGTVVPRRLQGFFDAVAVGSGSEPKTVTLEHEAGERFFATVAGQEGREQYVRLFWKRDDVGALIARMFPGYVDAHKRGLPAPPGPTLRFHRRQPDARLYELTFDGDDCSTYSDLVEAERERRMALWTDLRSGRTESGRAVSR